MSPKKKKKEKSPLQKQNDKTRRWYSKFIRLRDSDSNGYIHCVTCGQPIPWKEAHSGHFIHGLDWIEDNEHGQCLSCNYYKSVGDIYALWMIDNFGRERVDELYRLKAENRKYTLDELEEKLVYYKRKVEEWLK